jgi:hypothetical protein
VAGQNPATIFIQIKIMIDKLINDKDFIESFIANAEESYEYSGDFKNMFDIYEEEGLTEEQIGDLLDYCDKNDLINY